MNEQPEAGLAHIANELRRRGRRFALVGGMAVSIRGDSRTTQDVDLVVAVTGDADLEALVADLRQAGYRPFTALEQMIHDRLATVRLESPAQVVVDLLAASCGIEQEIVAAASPVEIEGVGPIPVARAEDLLAMKILSAAPRRQRDWDDARGLVEINPDLDLVLVRERLRLITTRGYARKQDLLAKLDKLLDEIQSMP